MRVAVSALVSALVLTAAGCGGDDEPADDASRPAPETSTDSEEPPDVDGALADAVRNLRQLPAISFRAEFGYGGRWVMLSEGVVGGGGWRATNAVDIADTFERNRVRSVAGSVWIQDPSWPEPANGCWLAVPEGEAPMGIGAQTAGLREPGYVDWLSRLEAIKWNSALHDEIAAKVPVGVMFGMLPAFETEGVSGKEPVRVRIELDGDRLSQLSVWSTDIDDAIEGTGIGYGDGPPGGELRVYYDDGDKAERVTPPQQDLVMNDVAAGCGHSA